MWPCRPTSGLPVPGTAAFRVSRSRRVLATADRARGSHFAGDPGPAAELLGRAAAPLTPPRLGPGGTGQRVNPTFGHRGRWRRARGVGRACRMPDGPPSGGREPVSAGGAPFCGRRGRAGSYGSVGGCSRRARGRSARCAESAGQRVILRRALRGLCRAPPGLPCPAGLCGACRLRHAPRGLPGSAGLAGRCHALPGFAGLRRAPPCSAGRCSARGFRCPEFVPSGWVTLSEARPCRTRAPAGRVLLLEAGGVSRAPCGPGGRG